MSTRSTTATPTELAEEASAWGVGGGIITMALFPLALPALALVAIAAIPLLLLALAMGLLVADVALPILLVRSLRRRAIRRGSAPARSPGRALSATSRAGTAQPR